MICRSQADVLQRARNNHPVKTLLRLLLTSQLYKRYRHKDTVRTKVQIQLSHLCEEILKKRMLKIIYMELQAEKELIRIAIPKRAESLC